MRVLPAIAVLGLASWFALAVSGADREAGEPARMGTAQVRALLAARSGIELASHLCRMNPEGRAGRGLGDEEGFFEVTWCPDSPEEAPKGFWYLLSPPRIRSWRISSRGRSRTSSQNLVLRLSIRD